MRTLSKAEQTANFWKLVDKKSDEQCWNWTGHTLNGYGGFYFQRERWRSHRLMWFLINGPTTVQILHKCDNKKCCNPNHLFEGTHTENMRDKASKGRCSSLKGEQNPFSKLTIEKVRTIRADQSNGITMVEIAKRIGVSPTTIRSIIIGRTWSHVI